MYRHMITALTLATASLAAPTAQAVSSAVFGMSYSLPAVSSGTYRCGLSDSAGNPISDEVTCDPGTVITSDYLPYDVTVVRRGGGSAQDIYVTFFYNGVEHNEGEGTKRDCSTDFAACAGVTIPFQT